MEKPHTFYIIYRLDKDWELSDGSHYDAGYYKYIYDLTGIDLPDCCQYSKDRYEWSKCDMFKSLGEFQQFFDRMNPKPMKMEHEEYIETIYYKGIAVPIFCDDYGQCFYCIFNGEVLSFGGYQTEYEDEVKSLIDYKLEKALKESIPS